MKVKKKRGFTLIEIIVCLALLLTLTSTFSYIGYDAVKEFRKRNGRAAFKDFVTILHHENGLKENHLMVLVYQNGPLLETTLGGNTRGLSKKGADQSFYVGDLFPQKTSYALYITPQAIPKDEDFAAWIEKNNRIYEFYKE
jgi:prepilin-type N-terminal cleavage/methylation domain-containing protein